MSDFADKSFDMIERLQKRIAELEAERRQEELREDERLGKMMVRAETAEQAFTAERQRREECEAVLREVARAPNRIAENARIIADYFGEGN